MNLLSKRINGLTIFLKHDLNIIDRKFEQANWLTADKKNIFREKKMLI